jgi:16S rRNA (guanine1516-N2)-methyltransferase
VTGGAADLILVETAEGLELRDAAQPEAPGVRADFRAMARTSRSRRQPLGRAIGPGATDVVDATAGLGGDAMLLARMGCTVTAIERCAIVARLLEDGLRRARAEPALAEAAARVRVVVGDAVDVLRAIARDAGRRRPDAVYVDPMFPPKRRSSALPPKSVQYLRRLVGGDEDAAAIVAAARATGARRIVVKRPSRGPALAGTPSFTIAGTLVRYDVYCGGDAPPDDR